MPNALSHLTKTRGEKAMACYVVHRNFWGDTLEILASMPLTPWNIEKQCGHPENSLCWKITANLSLMSSHSDTTLKLTDAMRG